MWAPLTYQKSNTTNHAQDLHLTLNPRHQTCLTNSETLYLSLSNLTGTQTHAHLLTLFPASITRSFLSEFTSIISPSHSFVSLTTTFAPFQYMIAFLHYLILFRLLLRLLLPTSYSKKKVVSTLRHSRPCY